MSTFGQARGLIQHLVEAGMSFTQKGAVVMRRFARKVQQCSDKAQEVG